VVWIFSFADDTPTIGAGESPSGNHPIPQPKPVEEPSTSGNVAVEEEAEDVVSIGAEVNDVMTTLLPWMTSILFHLGIIVLFMFAAWSYVVEENENNAPIIPIARLSEKPGGALVQGPASELQSATVARNVASEMVSTNGPGGGADSGLDLGSASGLQLIGVGSAAAGGGGKVAPLGATGGGGDVVTKFYGTGGNARRIIYIVDASGSLIDTLPFVLKELKRSINELSEKQQFTVIFFQGGDAIEVPPAGWKQATPEMRKAVADWVSLETGHLSPRGATNPVKAIQLAMQYRPELVYILSDNITGHGRYEVDREELLKLLNDRNKDRKIAINTIQFLYPDPLNTLKDIAAQHGGTFVFIKASDIGLK
jgi:hypothetical protein